MATDSDIFGAKVFQDLIVNGFFDTPANVVVAADVTGPPPATQGDAPLVSKVNFVTSTNNNDVITMPVGLYLGQEVTVLNFSPTNNLVLWPSSGQRISNQTNTPDVPVTIPPTTGWTFLYDGNSWFSSLLSPVGGSNSKTQFGELGVNIIGYPSPNITPLGITQNTTGVGTDVLGSYNNRVDAQSGLTAVTLPNETVLFAFLDGVNAPHYVELTVTNVGSENALVFPASGGVIDMGGTNAPVTIVPGQTKKFWNNPSVQYFKWHTLEDQRLLTTDNVTFNNLQYTGLKQDSADFGATATPAPNNDAAGGYPIDSHFTIITTATAHGEAVTLPKAIPGRDVYVVNQTIYSVDIYPQAGDSLSTGSGSPYSLGNTTNITVGDEPGKDFTRWYCVVPGVWGLSPIINHDVHRNRPTYATGVKDLGVSAYGVDTGVDLSTHTAQDSYIISATYSSISTTTAGSAITLPTPQQNFQEGGDYVIVYNGGANDVTVYPTSGDTIDGGNLTLPVGETATFIAYSGSQWRVQSDQTTKTTDDVTFSTVNAVGLVVWDTGAAKTSNFPAVSGKGYFCDTETTGAFTVTLPASPTTIGETIKLKDATNYFATAKLTIDPGANRIEGLVQTIDLVTNSDGVEITWSGPNEGWKFTSRF